MKLSKTLLPFLIICLFLTSCNTNKNISGSSENEKATLVISYEQSPGYNQLAPKYTIELYSNRQMFLTAIKNLDKEGRFMRTLTDAEYKQIINEFSNANFFNFKDEYTSDITDLPTRYISFNYEGKSKKIRDYYGAPELLGELELMIQSYLDRVGWSKTSW